MKILKSKKMKLPVTLFYRPGQEKELGNSWNVICKGQSSFCISYTREDSKMFNIIY